MADTTKPEHVEDRLERLARRLRQEGVIHLGERDLMIDAATLLREMREDLTKETR